MSTPKPSKMGAGTIPSGGPPTLEDFKTHMAEAFAYAVLQELQKEYVKAYREAGTEPEEFVYLTRCPLDAFQILNGKPRPDASAYGRFNGCWFQGYAAFQPYLQQHTTTHAAWKLARVKDIEARVKADAASRPLASITDTKTGLTVTARPATADDKEKFEASQARNEETMKEVAALLD